MVTTREVTDAAGVSIATVSRVLPGTRGLQAVGKTVPLIDAENDPLVEAAGIHRLLDRSVDALIAIPVDEHASVRQPLDRLAEAAVVRLMHPIDEGEPPSVERLVPSLQIRRSTVASAPSRSDARAQEAS